MDLAVILLNWRDEQRTLKCARAVLDWQELRPQLFVVDNESTAATSGILAAALPAGSLICSAANLGYGGGNNLGLKRALAASLDYTLLLNTDADISQAAVNRLLATLEAQPRISIVSPVIQEEDDSSICIVGSRDIAWHSRTRTVVSGAALKTFNDYPIHEVDFVSGTAILVRTSLWNEIGLLDEEYFFSGEVADFCKRTRDRGHAIAVDLEAEARHDSGQTPAHRRETLYVYYGLRNRFLYVKRHHARAKAGYFAYWTIYGAIAVARALLQGKRAKAHALVLALMHAYRGRYGDQNAALL